ncbi:hypothetical protein [Actinomadura livida]|uniref:Mce-associated membrane protein n=1 Tax=Actinomadura livida TaxID=79909 RepID=A0A7W7IKA0_9ACTN|nr:MULTISPECIES: hypothetical protein [Actinomadura]MBB4778248.1 Mce-associated membrane protein [Actinomadura catellatispora]GGU25960.1 hypothetical protein GCM10010208_58660 [Actinomadura livida]
MTMLGRGKRSARKNENAADDKARKAEEAAEAARLAEEAAAKAREAARLAQEAADAAAEDEPEPKKAVKTSEKPRRAKKAPEASGAPDDDADTAEETSEPARASVADEDAPEADEDVLAEESSVELDADEADAEEDEDDAEEEAVEAEKPKKPAKTAKPIKLKKPAAAEADDDEEEDDEDGGARGGATRSGYTVIAVLAVLVIAFGTAATMLYLKDREQNAVEAAGREGAWAASKAAKALSSYDFRTIDADMKTAADMTTGKLRSDYEKEMPSFKANATQQQLVGTTTVLKAGVVSATPDKVVVLVYANRTSATKDDETQRLPEALRLKMTMVETGGKWLAQDVDVIS